MSVEMGIKPTMNNMLVELTVEDGTLIKGPNGKIVKSGQSEVKAEQYCKVVAIGDQVKECVVGDYVLTRPNKHYDSFELNGKMYAFLSNFDIIAVISEEVISYMNSMKAKKLNTPLSIVTPPVDLAN